jgi:hypothetical protein
MFSDHVTGKDNYRADYKDGVRVTLADNVIFRVEFVRELIEIPKVFRTPQQKWDIIK